MKKRIWFLGVCALLCTCKNDTTRLHRQMENFAGSTVVIPEGIGRINYSDKEVDHRGKDALLVVYIDSVTCATCHIKGMFQYDEMITFGADSLLGYAPVFIFSPRRIQYIDVMRALQFTGLNYPALIDENGLFPAANPQIPSDGRFHTFLLDKNGKVVLFGDPVNNPQLWELYKTTIKELIKNGGAVPAT